MIGGKKRRVFIAINLPDDVKKYLRKISGKFALPRMRLAGADNLHLTLLFLGHISDNELLEVIKRVKEVARRTKPFEIDFKRIVAGPPDKAPRMIWLEGEKSRALAELKSELEKTIGGFARKKENRAFHPHLTLARFPEGLIKSDSFKPTGVDLTVPVERVEVMESVLKKSGAEHEVLESVELGKVF